jgi:hypothetical protein
MAKHCSTLSQKNADSPTSLKLYQAEEKQQKNG